MFDVVAARFKVELGGLAPFAEDVIPTLATRGRAGDGAALGIGLAACDTARLTVGSGSVEDFAVVAAEEPAEVSVPDFTFLCD